MSPKEKAKELIDKFHKFTYTAVHAHKTSGEYSDAKQCALIAVNEILEALKITTGHLTINKKLEQQELEMDFDYWDKVKQEIEKL